MMKKTEERIKQLEDNPEFDATDAAHPAWWRAHDYVSAKFKEKIAAAKRDIEDLAECEECGENAPRLENRAGWESWEGKGWPPRYCHGCQQKLVKRIIAAEERAEKAERERDKARFVLKRANEYIRKLFGELDDTEKERDEARTALEAARQMAEALAELESCWRAIEGKKSFSPSNQAIIRQTWKHTKAALTAWQQAAEGEKR